MNTKTGVFMKNKDMDIGDIGNAYGGLMAKAENGKFYWKIVGCEGGEWDEIPESLYVELVKFEKNKRP
jgi:hypothetical protein